MFKHRCFESSARLHATEKNSGSSAVLLGANNNSYDMRLMLNAKGIDVAVVSSVDELTSKISSGMLDDPDVVAAANSLLLHLEQNFASESALVVIPSADSYAILLSIIGASLSSKFLFRQLSPQLVRACSNKIFFSQLCGEKQISCPKTFVFNSNEEALDIINELPYPGIIKPHCAGALPEEVVDKVIVVNDKNELLTLTEKIIAYNQPVLYQELITGGTKSIVFAGGYRLGKDNFKCFIGQKLLEFPLAGGNTASAELIWNQDVAIIVHDLIKKLHYEGMFDIEFIFDQKDKQYKIIEINPRIGLWHSISDNCNMDIVSAYYNELIGNRLDEYRPHKENQKWFFPHIYFCSIVEKKGLFLGAFNWLHTFVKTDKVSGSRSRNIPVLIKRIRIAIGYVRRLPIKVLLFGR